MVSEHDVKTTQIQILKTKRKNVRIFLKCISISEIENQVDYGKVT